MKAFIIAALPVVASLLGLYLLTNYPELHLAFCQ